MSHGAVNTFWIPSDTRFPSSGRFCFGENPRNMRLEKIRIAPLRDRENLIYQILEVRCEEFYELAGKKMEQTLPVMLTSQKLKSFRFDFVRKSQKEEKIPSSHGKNVQTGDKDGQGSEDPWPSLPRHQGGKPNFHFMRTARHERQASDWKFRESHETDDGEHEKHLGSCELVNGQNCSRRCLSARSGQHRDIQQSVSRIRSRTIPGSEHLTAPKNSVGFGMRDGCNRTSRLVAP
jgi:hypothetical protein